MQNDVDVIENVANEINTNVMIGPNTQGQKKYKNKEYMMHRVKVHRSKN